MTRDTLNQPNHPYYEKRNHIRHEKRDMSRKYFDAEDLGMEAAEPEAPVIFEIFITPGSGTNAGATFTCNATASGNPSATLTYQWKRNGVNISGATSRNYTSTIADEAKTLTCTVVATNTEGTDTDTAAGVLVANMLVAPSITAIDINLSSGQVNDLFTANITATGFPAPTLTYQWKLNGENIEGANASTYTALAVGNLTVQAVATNSSGTDTDTSDATVVGLDHVVPVISSRSISPTSGVTGTLFTCNYAATGYPDPTASFQWKMDGVNIGGATSQTYTPSATGELTCVVTSTNSEGADSEETAAVTITTAPAIPVITSALVAPTSGAIGTEFTAAATVTGFPTPEKTYQWKLNGTNITDATGVTYTAIALGTLTCVITATNTVGSDTETSNSATVAAQAPEVLSAVITPAAGFEGDIFYCLASAAGTPAPTLTYQWERNGTPVSGETVAFITPDIDGTYTCVVTATNSAGTDSLESDGVVVADFAAPIEATGGTKTTYDDGLNVWTIHEFTTNGSFVVASGEGDIEVLLVGGGGGGGGVSGVGYGGGGGGGGVLEETYHISAAGTFPIVIGAGGLKASVDAGFNGGDSTAFGFTAKGGGGGGASSVAGKLGGSGGGGPTGNTGAVITAGAATSGQGFAGGSGFIATTHGPRASGGGGGAGAVGSNGASNVGGAGGPGKLLNYNGTSTRYGPGGGGYNNVAGGAGGTGGGGSGGTATNVAAGAATGIGAGGGGVHSGATANVNSGGTAGRVIVRYIPGESLEPAFDPTSVILPAANEEATVFGFQFNEATGSEDENTGYGDFVPQQSGQYNIFEFKAVGPLCWCAFRYTNATSKLLGVESFNVDIEDFGSFQMDWNTSTNRYEATVTGIGTFIQGAADTIVGITGIKEAMDSATLPASPTNNVEPSISGSNVVGSVLTAIDGDWDGEPIPTYTYAWYVNGSAVGVTTKTYTTTGLADNASVRVRVTATNSAGSSMVESDPLIMDIPATVYTHALLIGQKGLTYGFANDGVDVYGDIDPKGTSDKDFIRFFMNDSTDRFTIKTHDGTQIDATTSFNLTFEGYPSNPVTVTWNGASSVYQCAVNTALSAWFLARVGQEIGVNGLPDYDGVIVTPPPSGDQVWRQLIYRHPNHIAAAENHPDYQANGLYGGEGMQYFQGGARSISDPNVMLVNQDMGPPRRTFLVDSEPVWVSPPNDGYHMIGGLSVAIDPANPNYMLSMGNGAAHGNANAALAAQEGIWRTTNGCLSWSRRLTTSINRKGRWYHDTFACWPLTGGDPTSRAWKALVPSQSVLSFARSTDGGATWTTVALPSPMNSSRPYMLVQDPHNQNVLWAATGSGLWKSTDNGNNWTRPFSQFNFAQVSGFQQHDRKAVRSVWIDPDNANIMIVGCGDDTNPNFRGLYFTLNGGSTAFTKANSYNCGNVVITPKKGNGRRNVFVHQWKVTNNLAAIGEWTGSAFANWFTPTVSNYYPNDNSGHYAKLSGYDQCFWLPHPTNANDVYCHASAFTWRTLDGGVTWLGTGSTGQTGLSVRSFSFDSTGTRIAMAVADYQCMLSPDAGVTMTKYSLTAAQKDKMKAIALANPDMEPLSYFSGEAMMMLPNGRIIFSAGRGGDLGLFYIDRTATSPQWTWETALHDFLDNAAAGGGSLTNRFYGDYSRQNPSIVYCGANKSTNGGNSWASLSRAFLAISYQDGDIIFGADGQKGVARSVNAGGAFSPWFDSAHNITDTLAKHLFWLSPHDDTVAISLGPNYGLQSIKGTGSPTVTVINFETALWGGTSMPFAYPRQVCWDPTDPLVFYCVFNISGEPVVARFEMTNSTYNVLDSVTDITKNVPRTAYSQNIGMSDNGELLIGGGHGGFVYPTNMADAPIWDAAPLPLKGDLWESIP